MHFYKYQGTGNDFVMIDDRNGLFPAGDQKLIAHLCDRRFGIGADGLILLQENAGSGFYMQYFNSDGRESSMCGNGGRCFVRFICDLGLAEKEVEFHAIDGHHKAYVSESESSVIVSLQMQDVQAILKMDMETFELNTGSPHFVRFLNTPVGELNLIDEARKVRYSDTYATQGINVNYLNLKGLKEVEIRTYERGVEDETLSCGTGATAAALSLAEFNGLPEGVHEIEVHVKGGELKVKFHFHKKESRFSDVWLTGAAEKVFEGKY